MAEFFDFDALLLPIPGESPGGVEAIALQESAMIEEAVRADDVSNAGLWEVKNPKVAEWKKVIAIASEAIATKSKDLRLVARLGQALAVQHGVRGATEALQLTADLIDRFWDHIFPALDEGDAVYRRAQVESMITRLAVELAKVPITASGAGRFGLNEFLESKAVDQLRRGPTRKRPDGSEVSGQHLYDEAIAEGKISGEMYAAAMAETPPDHLVELRADVAACIAAMQRLRDVCALRMQDDPPAFGKLQDTLSKLSEVVGDATQARGIANIAPNGSIEAGAGNGAEISAQAIARPGGNIAFVASTGNSLASRQQALALLEQISSYFKASEPHSPIPLLIDRAVKWARLPLPEVLRELVEDDASLRNIDKLLGIARSE